MSRKSVRPLLVLAGLLPLALPAGAEARFTSGVQAGDVKSTSAILWARPAKSGPVALIVARNRRFTRGLRFFVLRSKKSNDYTVRKTVRRLKPNRRYYYRFGIRGTNQSRVGTFRTAPRRGQSRVIEFAYTGDTDFTRAPGQSRPFWNNGEIFRRMRLEKNRFNVHLGDTIYSDSEVPNRLFPIALRTGQKWRKYKRLLRNRQFSALRRKTPLYSHWDDHEFVNDFSRRENTFSNGVNINGETLFRRGRRAFLDYSPVKYTRTRGIYRSFRWGKNLEVFFLDERTFRDAKADEGGVCNNPQTGQPDIAPTAPQSIRNLFGLFLPETGLRRPVSQACLNAIRSPNRDFLGDAQFNRFTQAIKNSTARWKVVMNELPIQQYYVLPYDRWEGYESERQRLLQFLQQNVKNVIFLTTDVHATLVNQARFQTLEAGGPRSSGIWDFTVGPAATANFALEINDAVDNPNASTLVRSGFLTPQPPLGVGMRCAVLDRFSYGQVRVTANQLTVTSKGIDGNPIPGCAPLTLNFTP